jgi:hypothetical protein
MRLSQVYEAVYRLPAMAILPSEERLKVCSIVVQERWSLGGYAQSYSWAQCRYCGRAQSHDCPRVECLLCGTPQCFGNGSGNGLCAICHHGYLPGWSRGYSVANARTCQRAKCDAPAIATARRKTLCVDHARTVKVAGGITLEQYVNDRLEALNAGTLKVGLTPWKFVA